MLRSISVAAALAVTLVLSSAVAQAQGISPIPPSDVAIGCAQMPALTGDVSSSAGSCATTLATVNSNVGTFGSATACTAFTVNGKGLLTAASATTCTPAIGSVTGLGTGVATWLGTPSSANLISALTDETGTGVAVFSTSPTLVTPLLGTPTSGNLANTTGYPVAQLAGSTANVLAWMATPSSANLAAALSDETGSGLAVFATSPTLTTPLLGTPTSGNLVNTTGYTVANLAGTASGINTFLATSSSANLAAAVSDETGSGSLVFATSPTLVTPALGTPSSGDGTNLVNTPVTSQIVNGSFDLTTATGATQDLTYTFNPKACSGFGAVPAATLGTYATINSHSDSSANQAEVSFASSVVVLATDKFLAAADVTGGNRQTAVLSYGTNKVTLTWTKTGSPTGTFSYSVRCFK